jgi:Xaa-Pro aminopeptidase
MFNAKFYNDNRVRLLAECGDGLVIIAGNGLLQRVGDVNYSFRQDSNFLYLTGISEPDLVLVMNPSDKTEFVIVPDKDEVAVIFDGKEDTAEIEKVSGISSVLSETDGWAYIKKHATKQKTYFNNPSDSKVRGLFINPGRCVVYERLKQINPEPQDVRAILANLRMIKQDQEIVAISKAVAITKAALKRVESGISTSANEKDLLKQLNMHFIEHGVEHSFAPMVQGGKNATTLHYDKNNQELLENGAVLLDVGAEYQGYAADISRTYIKGENPRAQAVISAVKSVQEQVIAYVKPGVSWREMSDYALKLVADELLELGVITDEKEAQSYFPHAIGHFLGLDVHDVGDYTQPLQAGMVITVEPGIYIPEESIGVRIEDDILLTKTGAKVL